MQETFLNNQFTYNCCYFQWV